MTAMLEAIDIWKQYAHVHALSGASFHVDAGEVVSLIGDNGAGKSTLVRILSGIEQPDRGSLRIDGQQVVVTSAAQARDLGIETVFQDLALAPHLDPIRNLYLGRELMRPGILGRLGFMDDARMRVAGKASLRSLKAAVRNFSGPIGAMSGGQKQSVAVCRAATWAKRLTILDEPTAALGVVQTRNVLDLIRRVRDTGIAVILVSHSMPHVMEISDRITVLRRGQTVAQYRPADATMEELVGAMTGALEGRVA